MFLLNERQTDKRSTGRPVDSHSRRKNQSADEVSVPSVCGYLAATSRSWNSTCTQGHRGACCSSFAGGCKSSSLAAKRRAVFNRLDLRLKSSEEERVDAFLRIDSLRRSVTLSDSVDPRTMSSMRWSQHISLVADLMAKIDSNCDLQEVRKASMARNIV